MKFEKAEKIERQFVVFPTIGISWLLHDRFDIYFVWLKWGFGLSFDRGKSRKRDE